MSVIEFNFPAIFPLFSKKFVHQTFQLDCDYENIYARFLFIPFFSFYSQIFEKSWEFCFVVCLPVVVQKFKMNVLNFISIIGKLSSLDSSIIYLRLPDVFLLVTSLFPFPLIRVIHENSVNSNIQIWQPQIILKIKKNFKTSGNISFNCQLLKKLKKTSSPFLCYEKEDEWHQDFRVSDFSIFKKKTNSKKYLIKNSIRF